VASDWPQDTIRAAGAVVWRPGSDGAQVVLVHRPKYDDWSFPKGKSERGEHPLLTATREVAEETGLRVVLGRRLKASEYEVDGRPKKVRYWAARRAESLGFRPGREVDDLAWLELPQAAARLSYERDRVLLDEFAAAPPATIPLILLRHAQAGTKARGQEADLARSLDQQGAADAKLLAELLSSYGSCRVLTSAAQRCIASVRPYAQAIGMPVEVERDFTTTGDEADGDDDYGPAARRTAELVAQRRPTLICAHRENLPVMLGAAKTALGAGADVVAEPPLGKGSFVVLQSADGVLVSAERQDLGLS
jgi:8-oxo-dGTP pyrophosphatase MutT (NUDIX family)/phosphohistidine phosphatase SixA